MKMKLLIVGFAILLAFQSALAQNIEKMWGISAGLYENQLNEISVSYGFSNRAAVLLFTNLDYTNSNTDEDKTGAYTTTGSIKNSALDFAIGGELRGYFYLNRVAPFGGVRFSVGSQNNKFEISDSDWKKTRALQVKIGLTYGAEYFFKSNFSIYLAMSLFEYSLTQQVDEIYVHNTNLKTEDTSRIHNLLIKQNPAVFVKIYF